MSWPEWISALGSVGQALAVVFGVCVAKSQLNQWRHEALTRKRVERADRLLELAHEAFAIIRMARDRARIHGDAISREIINTEEAKKHLNQSDYIFVELHKARLMFAPYDIHLEVTKAVDNMLSLAETLRKSLERWESLSLNEPVRGTYVKKDRENLQKIIATQYPDVDEFDSTLLNSFEEMRCKIAPTLRFESQTAQRRTGASG